MWVTPVKETVLEGAPVVVEVPAGAAEAPVMQAAAAAMETMILEYILGLIANGIE